MPQTLLPLFASGEGFISELISYQKKDGSVYYFHAGLPVFSHGETDLKSYRMFTSQLAVSGVCRQVDIIRAFGISAISMKRWVKKYREEGPEAFFKTPRRRSEHVLMPEVLQKTQDLLSQGVSRSEAAKQMNLKSNTLSKAICAGRLTEPVKKKT